MGFKYRIWRRGEMSYISIEAPERIGKTMVARSAQTLTYDLSRNLLQDSNQTIQGRRVSVDHRFNHKRIDIAMQVGYCKGPLSSCEYFGLTSVTSFIEKNNNSDQSSADSSN